MKRRTNERMISAEIFLTTKLSPRDQGEDSAYQACLESLKRLNTEYVDMYLIHWPGAGKSRKAQEVCGR